MVHVTPDPELVVRLALGRVLDPVLVDLVRGDSPVMWPPGAYGAVGVALSAADAVALADAVQQVAREAGAECILVDEDLTVQDGPVTLDRLTASVSRRWRESGQPPSGQWADGADRPGEEDA